MLSTLFCIIPNKGPTFLTRIPIETTSIGKVTANITANFPLILIDNIIANISITGALTRSLTPIVTEFCTAVISVVRRVINDAVLNFSIFLNEYV